MTQTANACPGIAAGGHPGVPCPDADADRCLVHSGGHSAALDLAPEARVRRAGKCPGGHCGFGVDGCTICRPVTITLLPGCVNLSQHLQEPDMANAIASCMAANLLNATLPVTAGGKPSSTYFRPAGCRSPRRCTCG